MLCPRVEDSRKLDTDVDFGPHSLLDTALSSREYAAKIWHAYGAVLGERRVGYLLTVK